MCWDSIAASGEIRVEQSCCFLKKNKKNSGFTSDLCDILMFTFLALLPKEDQGSNKSWPDRKATTEDGRLS